jgi:hypothetical protein
VRDPKEYAEALLIDANEYLMLEMSCIGPMRIWKFVDRKKYGMTLVAEVYSFADHFIKGVLEMYELLLQRQVFNGTDNVSAYCAEKLLVLRGSYMYRDANSGRICLTPSCSSLPTSF